MTSGRRKTLPISNEQMKKLFDSSDFGPAQSKNAARLLKTTQIFWPTKTRESTSAKANKRSQHFNTTYPNIIGPASAISGRTIATSERNISQHASMPRRNIVVRIWPNDCSIIQLSQMLHEKFDLFSQI